VLNDVLVFVAKSVPVHARQHPYTPRCCNVSTHALRHFSRKFNLARSDTFWREFDRELESDVAGKKMKNGTRQALPAPVLDVRKSRRDDGSTYAAPLESTAQVIDCVIGSQSIPCTRNFILSKVAHGVHNVAVSISLCPR
jgi:plasmid stabilization system protein ParE